MAISEAQKLSWLKQDLWTLAEAAHLLAGHEPGVQPPLVAVIDKKVYTADLDTRLEAVIYAHAENLNFTQSVQTAYEALTRAIECQTLSCAKNKWLRPAEVIRWVCQSGLWPQFPFSDSDLVGRPAPTALLAVKQRTIQTDWILNTIRTMGYEPSKLPRKPNGGLGWRGEVQKRLPYLNHPPNLTVPKYKKLWQHLRDSGEINEI